MKSRARTSAAITKAAMISAAAALTAFGDEAPAHEDEAPAHMAVSRCCPGGVTISMELGSHWCVLEGTEVAPNSKRPPFQAAPSRSHTITGVCDENSCRPALS